MGAQAGWSMVRRLCSEAYIVCRRSITINYLATPKHGELMFSPNCPMPDVGQLNSMSHSIEFLKKLEVWNHFESLKHVWRIMAGHKCVGVALPAWSRINGIRAAKLRKEVADIS